MKLYRVKNKVSGEFIGNQWLSTFAGPDHYEPGFGLPERWVNAEHLSEEQIQAALESRELELGGMEYWMPAEFEVIEEDITPNIQEQKWKELRKKRDELLAASDFTQLADSPLNSEQKQVWRVYRQALRNLPQQSGDPDNIIWPEKPE
jgi:hypothetical protein